MKTQQAKTYGMQQMQFEEGSLFEKSQINNLTLHLKQLEKEQTKPKLVERNHKDQSRNK